MVSKKLRLAWVLPLFMLTGCGDGRAAGGSGSVYLTLFLLFLFCVALGIVAVIAGIGGGVLFVPIVTALFPFHFDYVRGAGLIVSMCGALAAAPTLLGKRMSSLRLAAPFAFVGSFGSMLGARIGLSMPEEVVQLLLSVLILGIVCLMLFSRKSDFPETKDEKLSAWLGIGGVYSDPSLGGKEIPWSVHRTVPGFFAFFFIGLAAGMFGLGAGWGNVPALNLLLGAPLKLSVATSGLVISIVNNTAVLVYLKKGAILAQIAAPAVAGMMVGARIGAKILPHVPSALVKKGVIILLLIVVIRSILSLLPFGF